jgi:SHS2 domain-containing protein
MPTKRVYRLLEHTADLRMRIVGRTLRDLFQNAVVALTDTLTDWKKVRTSRSVKLRFREEGLDLLLARLLRELLFLFDARAFVARRLEFSRFDVTMTPKVLEARVWGERFSPDRHPPKTEIKAVTYHRLKVEKRRGRWAAEVVFDV